MDMWVVLSEATQTGRIALQNDRIKCSVATKVSHAIIQTSATAWPFGVNEPIRHTTNLGPLKRDESAIGAHAGVCLEQFSDRA